MAFAERPLPCCAAPTTPLFGLLPPPFSPPLKLLTFMCMCAGTRFIWHPVGAYFHQAGLWRIDADPHGCLIPHPSWCIVLY